MGHGRGQGFKTKKVRRQWTAMLANGEFVRQRLEMMPNNEVVIILDYLQTRVAPFAEGFGWTVFNDWLDLCYQRGHMDRKRPSQIPFLFVETIRKAVFPSAPRTSA